MIPPERSVHDRHLGVDQLGDLVDGLFEPAERSVAEAHLASCGVCAARLRGLEALLARAADAPASIEPPRDLWPAVRARIAGPVRRREAGRWAGWRAPLAAAASLILAVGAATVAARLRGRADADGPGAPATAAATTAAATTAAATPGGYEQLDAEYARAAAQLSAAVNAERGALAPATVATVERSVRAIDAAIAEAHSALGRDPRNPVLVEMLAVSYEQKLALLKRTADLSSDL